jgi:hypothetical protein
MARAGASARGGRTSLSTPPTQQPETNTSPIGQSQKVYGSPPPSVPSRPTTPAPVPAPTVPSSGGYKAALPPPVAPAAPAAPTPVAPVAPPSYASLAPAPAPQAQAYNPAIIAAIIAQMTQGGGIPNPRSRRPTEMMLPAPQPMFEYFIPRAPMFRQNMRDNRWDYENYNGSAFGGY